MKLNKNSEIVRVSLPSGPPAECCSNRTSTDHQPVQAQNFTHISPHAEYLFLFILFLHKMISKWNRFIETVDTGHHGFKNNICNYIVSYYLSNNDIHW